MEELNKLLVDIERLNKKIYETDIFIRFYLKQLQDKFPKVWRRFSDLKKRYLELKNIEDVKPLDNPLVKESEPEENNENKEKTALKKFKKKKCKELYKRISNITHPDKVVNEYLNELFIIAKKYKDVSDLRGLENIYEVVQKQAQEPSYDFFATKLVELKQQLDICDNTHRNQIMSFEYRVAVLYECSDDASKREAENIFVSKLNELMKFYSKEIERNVY